MKKNYIWLALCGLLVLGGCNQKETSTSNSTSEKPQVTNDLNAALQYAKNHSFSVFGDIYSVFEQYGGEIKMSYLNNSFADGIISNQKAYYYDENELSEEAESIYYKKADGKTYYKTITLKNEVAELEYLVDGKSVLFDDNFHNPFKKLKYSDFVEGKTESEFILKPSSVNAFAQLLTHTSLSCKNITFVIENNQFSSVLIETYASVGSLGLNTAEKYDLDFLYDISLEIPTLTPFEHKKEHDQLEIVCKSLNDQLSSLNYTATITTSNLDGTQVSSQTSYYVVQEALYHDSPDSYGRCLGVVLQNDGLHEFYTEGLEESKNIVVSEEKLDGTRKDYEPNYTGFASELFDCEGNTYYVKDAFVPYITYLLAPYTIRDYLAYFAFECMIQLDNLGGFKNLVIRYSDTMYMQSGMVQVSYHHFNTTNLPIQF